MLLLHLMSALFPRKVRAIYINHQLQKVSDVWAIFVQEQCLKLNIPCIIQNVDVQQGNLENQAREARYQAFAKHLDKGEILVLAHHQQDQAETLLLRLLSGTGVQGMAAMRSIDVQQKIDQDIHIWRPLLNISREQICQWVQQSDIQYVDDPTNLDTHYDRAWCRHELWKILQSRYPKMQQALARTTVLMQDADEILNEVLQQDLAKCGDATQLDLTAFLQLSKARQRQFLSAWMRGDEQYRPTFDMVERLQREVIEAREDAQSALHNHGFYYVRYQGILYRLTEDVYLAERKNNVLQHTNIIFKLNTVQKLIAGQFHIENVFTNLIGQDQQIEKKIIMGLSPLLLGKKLQLTQRQGGEKIHLYGRVGSWPLKKAIQQAHIFPWMRHTIQILSIDNVMLGVFTPKGFWLAQSEYCVEAGWQPTLISCF